VSVTARSTGCAETAREPEANGPTGNARTWLARLPAIDRLIAVTTAAGGAICLWMIAEWGSQGWPFPVAAVLVTSALAFVGVAAEVPVAIGARQFRFSWSETSLLVGLAFVSLPLLVLLKTLMVLIEHLRRRREWRRVVFNAFVESLSTWLAGAMAVALASTQHVELGSPGSWPILAAAGAVATVISGLMVAGAVSASSEASWIKTALARPVASELANYAGNVIVSLLIIGGWRYSRSSLLALPLVLILIWQAHNKQVHKSTERDALGRLAAASAAMPALSLVEMTDEVRKRAADLFGARGVQLRLAEHSTATPESRATPTVVPGGVEVELIGRRGSLGLLAIDVEQPGYLTRQERDVLVTFANSTAAALETVLAHAAQLHAAQHDTLTGLPNRALLAESAGRTLAAATAAGTRCAMVLLDLNGFKNVNDTLGHAAGDKLLVEIGSRLASSVRPGDYVARLGGDEFVVLLDHIDADIDAGALAAGLVDRIALPVTIDGLRIAVEGSAGVAMYPDDGDNAEALLRCADVAMYGAKRRGHSVVHYDSSQDLTSPEKLGLLADLQSALDADDQLSLHFQPQLDLRTGLTGNVEALVRWRHPIRGPLSPADFVPIIEHSALIGPFTAKILEEAVRCCVGWQNDASLHGVGVAVNLSARNLMHRDLPDEVARTLARHGLPARKLVLEITETAAMNDTEVCESVLGRLRDLGVRLSVDDFGTGYASLTFLRRIDVAEVKLDRAFVADMLEDEAAATIVGATVALAHGLGLTVVAEGVETSEQLTALSLAGCDLAQGYFLSRPVPVELLADGAESAVAKAAIEGVIEPYPRRALHPRSAPLPLQHRSEPASLIAPRLPGSPGGS
jgi:diguanylate cyclase (GGDEF)-like protein